MRTRSFALLTALALTPGLAAAAEPQACTGKTGQPGRYDVQIQSGGITRTFHLQVPSSYRADVPTPLVINFHGFTDNGLNHEAYTGMSEKGEAEGFITIHPEGYENSWNGGSCCGQAVAQGIDDVKFAREMVAYVAASWCLDTKRVHATGFSNGGYMSHRLACEASDVFASVAPASGLIGIPNCTPPRAVPVIQSQGSTDVLVSYNNSKASNDYWAAYNGCGAASQVYKKGTATCIAYSNCKAGATVEWCEVKGMPHRWPGSEGTPGYLNATDTFWDFFTKHPMP